MPSSTSVFSSTTPFLLFSLLTTALGPFQFGYHLAELNAPQAVITCQSNSVKATTAAGAKLPQCIPMSVEQFAIVSSIFTLGGFLGALAAGPYSSSYGRLRILRIMALVLIVGPIVESSGPSIAVLSIGRFISGLGAGAALVVVPMYISETCPPEKRGLFGAMTQILCNVGILVTQILGYLLSYGPMWRVTLAVAAGVAFVQFLGLSFVPESPKWLAEHGDSGKARHILMKLRGRGIDVEDETKGWGTNTSIEDNEEEESLIRTPSNQPPSPKQKASVGILAAILNPQYRPAIIAVIAAMAAQQFTGINSIIMYSVSLLSSLLPTSAALLTIAVSALNLIMTTACAPLPDRIGRKTCILLSTVGMGISSILIATGISKGIKVLGAIATLTFVASFAAGLGPVPFILANEMADAEAVGATQSWALAANWVATFIVSQFFPIINERMGNNGSVYYVFAALAVVLGAFIAWYVPETRGKKNADEVWGRKGRERDRLE